MQGKKKLVRAEKFQLVAFVNKTDDTL